MGDPTASSNPFPLASDASALAFAVVRPVLMAGTLDELGRCGVDIVHEIAPRATSTFTWQFAGWGGPAAWRRSPRDSATRPLETWRPLRDNVVGPGVVTWESPGGSQSRHCTWLPVGAGQPIGGFEIWQRDPFHPDVVGRLASVAEAVSWSAGRLRDRQRAQEEQQQIRATVEARTAFFAQMSHELRTPLNAILGYVELIREERDRLTMDDVVADLARVHASATHLVGLVNDILDLAKAESGKAEMERQPVSVTRMVEEIDDLARPLVADQGNRWIVDCAEDLWVWGDPRRIYQVLTNLVSNAAKFTEHGEVKLTVARLGEDVTMTVADTGVGMSPSKLSRIFVPFEQVHDDDAPRHPGTGLGLAIAAQYVHQMGGAIDVQSRVGLGSRFVVTLPAAHVPPRRAGSEPG